MNYTFRMNFSRSGPSSSPKPSPKPHVPNPHVALESNPKPNVALESNPQPIPVTRGPIALLAPLVNQTDRFSMSRLIHFKATGGCRSCS